MSALSEHLLSESSVSSFSCVSESPVSEILVPICPVVPVSPDRSLPGSPENFTELSLPGFSGCLLPEFPVPELHDTLAVL